MILTLNIIKTVPLKINKSISYFILLYFIDSIFGKFLHYSSTKSEEIPLLLLIRRRRRRRRNGFNTHTHIISESHYETLGQVQASGSDYRKLVSK